MRTLGVLIASILAINAADAAPNRDVAINWDDVCAVDAKGAIKCTDEKKDPMDAPIARQIAFGFMLVILDEKGKVVVWDHISEKVEALALPFTTKQIGFIGADLCAFGTKGELACGKPEKDGMKLHDAPKGVRFVSASFDNESIWLLDDKRNLWCEGGSSCARLRYAWNRVERNTPIDDDAWRGAYPSPIDRVPDVARWRVASDVTRVVTGGDVCIERPKQPLTCWDFSFGPRTYKFEAYDELVTVGGQACRRKGDTIRCTYLDSRLHEIYADSPKNDSVSTTLTVKGAVGLYTQEQKLCVADKAGAVSCTKVAGNNTVPAFTAVTWAK